MKIFVVYKVRKEQDSYQTHTWRMVFASNDETVANGQLDSMSKHLSSQEIKAGWAYEKAPVEATII